MICSFIDGRVRIRAAALKDPAKMALVESAVKEQPGVHTAVANLRTGSLLVEYDPQVISREMLTMAAQALEAQLGEAPQTEKTGKNRAQCRRGRSNLLPAKTEMALLTAAFGLTLAGGIINTRLHVVAGLLFSLFAANHIYCRRGRL